VLNISIAFADLYKSGLYNILLWYLSIFFQFTYCCVVAVVVLATCAVASASPFQLRDNEYHPQQEHYESTTADHSDDVGGSLHKPGSTYHFQYSVHDPLTGDEKSQNEVGDGHGSVKGTYSLVEPDGSTRVVEYTADDEHGFRAEVKRIEPAHRQQHDQSQSVTAPSYKFDFAAEHAAAASPQVDYELQQSLHYNYLLQEPELHQLSSSHRWSLSPSIVVSHAVSHIIIVVIISHSTRLR